VKARGHAVARAILVEGGLDLSAGPSSVTVHQTAFSTTGPADAAAVTVFGRVVLDSRASFSVRSCSMVATGQLLTGVVTLGTAASVELGGCSLFEFSGNDVTAPNSTAVQRAYIFLRASTLRSGAAVTVAANRLRGGGLGVQFANNLTVGLPAVDDPVPCRIAIYGNSVSSSRADAAGADPATVVWLGSAAHVNDGGNAATALFVTITSNNVSSGDGAGAAALTRFFPSSGSGQTLFMAGCNRVGNNATTEGDSGSGGLSLGVGPAFVLPCTTVHANPPPSVLAFPSFSMNCALPPPTAPDVCREPTGTSLEGNLTRLCRHDIAVLCTLRGPHGGDAAREERAGGGEPAPGRDGHRVAVHLCGGAQQLQRAKAQPARDPAGVDADEVVGDTNERRL